MIRVDIDKNIAFERTSFQVVVPACSPRNFLRCGTVQHPLRVAHLASMLDIVDTETAFMIQTVRSLLLVVFDFEV